MDSEGRPRGRTLVAGVGNLLMGDDGAGVHAARMLEAEAEPRSFDVIDAGTSLADIVGLLARYDRLILVDAVRGGGSPGTVYEIEVRDPGDLRREQAPVSLHEMGVGDALRQAALMGIQPREVWIVGVEPGRVDWGIGLTAEVEAALPRLLERVRELARR